MSMRLFLSYAFAFHIQHHLAGLVLGDQGPSECVLVHEMLLAGGLYAIGESPGECESLSRSIPPALVFLWYQIVLAVIPLTKFVLLWVIGHEMEERRSKRQRTKLADFCEPLLNRLKQRLIGRRLQPISGLQRIQDAHRFSQKLSSLFALLSFQFQLRQSQ